MWAMIEKFRSRSWGMVTGGECSRDVLGGDSGHPFLMRAYVRLKSATLAPPRTVPATAPVT